MFYRNMTHGFCTACLLVCLYVVHILWGIIGQRNETFKTKGETFILAKKIAHFSSKSNGQNEQ